VNEVRSYTSDCALDAGGQQVVWLRGVRSEDSVALLGKLVKPQAFGDAAAGAIMTIGAHAGKAADAALLNFVRTGSAEARQRALVRLGSGRGKTGFEALHGLATADKNPDLRQQALFAMAWSHEPEAEQALLTAAREDSDPAVRGRALTLYASRAGSRALPVLTEAIQDASQPAVRSAAILALRHLPEEERREVLNDLASRSPDPEIRSQARGMLYRMAGQRPLDGPAARSFR
jgi:HEAT repeat protein